MANQSDDNVGPQRPQADKLVYQIFHDKKCGKGKDEGKSFYEWCMDPKAKTQTTECVGMNGGAFPCEYTQTFLYPSTGRDVVEYQAKLNGTTTTTTSPSSTTESGPSNVTATTPDLISTTPAYEPPTKIPDRLQLNFVCKIGNDPNKYTRGSVVAPVKPEEFEELTRMCYQEIYGVTGLPFWLILLIILLIISALAAASVLFWKYWLRQRLFGGQRSGRRGGRGVGSGWTSAPISNASAFTSTLSKTAPFAGPTRPSRSETNGGVSASRSRSSSSNRPSVRSNLTQGNTPGNTPSRGSSRR